MKRLKQLTLVLVALLLSFSCGPRVTTDSFNDSNMNKYKSFAYLPNTTFEAAENMGEIDETVGVSVITALNNNMVSEGYKVNRSNPDMLVLLTTIYNTEYERELEPTYATFPTGYNYPVSPYYASVYYDRYKTYSTRLPYDLDYEAYKEGTLIVEIFDTESKDLIWRGIAEDYLSDIGTELQVINMVEEIFEEFPG